ncbi:MAG: hypothetical protein IT445_14990 [Phycisphaeraceae bacterium]|nr:hypothetical protein [Phycisphaeraceae bacterium]
MASHITRASKHGFKKKMNLEVNQPQRVNPIYITGATLITDELDLTFDQVVSLHGLPGVTTDVAGAVVTDAQQLTPNQIKLFFSAEVSSATKLNIPFRDPAIRNPSGGYVTHNVYSLV